MAAGSPQDSKAWLLMEVWHCAAAGCPVLREAGDSSSRGVCHVSMLGMMWWRMPETPNVSDALGRSSPLPLELTCSCESPMV